MPNTLSCLLIGAAILAGVAAIAADPVIVRSDVVYDDGPALIPIIGKTHKGNLLVAFNTRGDALPLTEVKFVRSSDEGKTWSNPCYNLTDPEDNVGVSVGLLQILSIPGSEGRDHRLALFPMFV
jgi:hypothetical protein